ncbi:hypothetical protein HY992_01800 [Candidatus Micrarchaeota archaeon]|nr:hypothetical protein [Candidatus Micrarchaeota archaeon]
MQARRATRVRLRKPLYLNREWQRQMRTRGARRKYAPQTEAEWRFCRLLLVEERILHFEDRKRPSTHWTPIELIEEREREVLGKKYDGRAGTQESDQLATAQSVLYVLKLAALRYYVRERTEHVRDMQLDVDVVLADIADETAQYKASLRERGVTNTVLPLMLRNHAARLPHAGVNPCLWTVS